MFGRMDIHKSQRISCEPPIRLTKHPTAMVQRSIFLLGDTLTGRTDWCWP